MKYIRTETNLFEVVGENALVYKVKGKRDSEKIYSISKHYGKIIKEADTIEELCDEFVMADTESGYCGILPKDKEIKFDKVNMGNAYGRKFYGAIWTDKGLIYVAKMNENGELELL